MNTNMDVIRVNRTFAFANESERAEVISIAKEIEGAASNPSATIIRVEYAPKKYQEILKSVQKGGKYSSTFDYDKLNKIPVQKSFSKSLIELPGWNRISQLKKAERSYAAMLMSSRTFGWGLPKDTLKNILEDAGIDYPKNGNQIYGNYRDLGKKENQKFTKNLCKKLGITYDIEMLLQWESNRGDVNLNNNREYMKKAAEKINELVLNRKSIKLPFEIVAEPSREWFDSVSHIFENPYKDLKNYTPDVAIRYGDNVIIGEIFSDFGGTDYKKRKINKIWSCVFNTDRGIHLFKGAATCITKDVKIFEDEMIASLKEFKNIEEKSGLEQAVVNWVVNNDNVTGETNLDVIYNLLYKMLSSEELVGKGKSLATVLPLNKTELFI